ncbi:MAG: ParB/RepB/Spo0J family partition protein [Patescibacteria group bacterium]|jgi:ParB family chromosome partitioning protein
MLGRQSGLGRGLGALIPQRSPAMNDMHPPIRAAASSGPGTSVQMLPLDRIDPNPHQPRTHFDHGDLEDLVGSIKEHGILQPIVVTVKNDGRYELIAGERRLRASKIAGLEEIPALIRSATEQQKMELAIIENVQRSDLNPIEEAHAYLRLQNEFGMTQDEVGVRVGKSRPQVGNIIRLLQLPDLIQRALMEGTISMSNARTLLSLPTDQERLSLFEQMVAGNFTVRQTEARVAHPRRSVGIDPNLAALEQQFRAAFGTRVTVKRDARGEGEVRIRFLNDEDLETIRKKIVGE